ncbi:expressed unknown protein [Seminavis robusta]|uniref:Uncharacterized protein n=1 Tax=Seminavis robusta TaxID=568900 RepID=A0A9N8HIZ8_9STRA|nr:expressed unknown protein [Seminavis robusta]|eukprot:Sro625_g177630.1 n/a (359) ;mRNA; f:38849-39925
MFATSSNVHNPSVAQLARLKKNDEYLTFLNVKLQDIEHGVSNHFPHWRDSIFSFQVAQWIDALQTNNTVEEVTVDLTIAEGQGLGLWEARNVRTFLESVAAIPSLEKLVFKQYTLGSLGSFAGIRSAIENARSLTHLEIWGKRIVEGSQEELHALAHAIRQKPQLRSFHFHGFLMHWFDGGPEPYVRSLLPVLDNPSLKELKLGDTNPGQLPLLEALGTNHNHAIETLTLVIVPELLDEVCDKIQQVLLLPHNSHVRSLSLVNSTNRRLPGISAKGFQSLTHLMEHNHSLMELNTSPGTQPHADIEFYLRLNKAGRKILFEPDATRKDWVNVLCALLPEDSVESLFYILQLNPCLCEI